jgi:hypothetical protein
MKTKTNRRKKVQRSNDLVLLTIKKDHRCPSCRKTKDQVIHFIHKNKLTGKRVIELLMCKDCILLYRKEALEKKDAKLLPFVPIFNSMLKSIGEYIEPEEIEKQVENLMKDDTNIIDAEIVNEPRELENKIS